MGTILYDHSKFIGRFCQAHDHLPPNYGAHLAGSRREKGFWSSLLPFYSIGVIAFLAYTLSKMWLKTDTNGVDNEHAVRSTSLFRNGREGGSYLRSLNDGQLKRLREQLLETEEAMQQILEGLESDHVNKNTAKNDFQEALASLKRLTDLTAGKLLYHFEERQSQPSLEPSIEDLLHDLENVLERFALSKEACGQAPEKADFDSKCDKIKDDVPLTRSQRLQVDLSVSERPTELNHKKTV
ncbi:hypothetical protein D918_06494 [Trichuris suis]|nr:hypothetical protein D918_06494 [Trichuris suis]